MPLTYDEQAARIAQLEAELAGVGGQLTAAVIERDALRAENARLTALVPPDTDGTGFMTISEYRYHAIGAYRALGVLPSSTANTALKTKWDLIMRGLETLDQTRRINTKVAPFLQVTNELYTDGLIPLAKKTYLDTFGA